jgi:5'-methylthioadenosine phosphorylase
MCYTSVALITDFDAGIDAQESVHQANVLEVFAQNIDRLRELITETIKRLPVTRSCPCPTTLDGLEPRLRLPD